MHRLSRWSSKLYNFSEKGIHRCDDHAVVDMCCGFHQCVSNITSTQRSIEKKTIRRLKIEGSVNVDVSYAAPQAHGIVNVALH
jgi:hypothetical protein